MDLKSIFSIPKWKSIFFITESESIPSEFLDSLTCKRMDIPMLLPCGQYVDRSSLDNYNEIEAKWGRSPNDPFTGLVFTDARKAIFDDKLKARIDSFVLGIAPKPVCKVRKTEEKEIEFKGQSLDSIYEQILQGRPRILGQKKKNLCQNCGGDSDLYKGECLKNCQETIFMCRHCLISLKNFPKCSKCSKTWTRSQFSKIHSGNFQS